MILTPYETDQLVHCHERLTQTNDALQRAIGGRSEGNVENLRDTRELALAKLWGLVGGILESRELVK